MSGHASKIGNDVSQALFDGRIVPDSAYMNGVRILLILANQKLTLEKIIWLSMPLRNKLHFDDKFEQLK